MRPAEELFIIKLCKMQLAFFNKKNNAKVYIMLEASMFTRLHEIA